MSDTCWVSFGPDLEPLRSASRRSAASPGPRGDGLLVAGAAADVAAHLADACRSDGGWCSLETLDEAGEQHPVHLNAHQVRWVGPA